jgi:hypothetical protein
LALQESGGIDDGSRRRRGFDGSRSRHSTFVTTFATAIALAAFALRARIASEDAIQQGRAVASRFLRAAVTLLGATVVRLLAAAVTGFLAAVVALRGLLASAVAETTEQAVRLLASALLASIATLGIATLGIATLLASAVAAEQAVRLLASALLASVASLGIAALLASAVAQATEQAVGLLACALLASIASLGIAAVALLGATVSAQQRLASATARGGFLRATVAFLGAVIRFLTAAITGFLTTSIASFLATSAFGGSTTDAEHSVK